MTVEQFSKWMFRISNVFVDGRGVKPNARKLPVMSCSIQYCKGVMNLEEDKTLGVMNRLHARQNILSAYMYYFQGTGRNRNRTV